MQPQTQRLTQPPTTPVRTETLNPDLTSLLPDILQTHVWTATATAALVAVFAALVVHRVGLAVLRRVARDTVVVKAIIEATQRAAGAVLPLAALQIIWVLAPDTLAHISTVRHGNALLLIAALTWFVMGVINGLADGLIARHPVSVSDDLEARRIQTQAHVLSRSANVLLVIGGASMALMTFPGARQLGASLLASAGVLGLVGGIAARPVFSNLIAGLQLAFAQPIRIDDVLIVKDQHGRVEEITGSYVVMKLWDERRMIVPLNWFIENPFENWTRSSSKIVQSVFFFVDFTMPLEALRAELDRLLAVAPEWDKRVGKLAVIDATESSMKIRVLVSAENSGLAGDLGHWLREQLIAFVARDYPQCLPRTRQISFAQSASQCV
ncbi:mechanosensitive ion channel [Caenimonas koreensis DSM 17982]|uniref:Mechanosensitive ion channel n=1 Tax=Caenimonas koreensis DSM 17982 TaxID=1121255 RepID=A0A844B8R2_9BURK|nr:mechanosensitive ion channel domain-containing protein [Caenimonas koreensis]MRD47836.1 mechanosensitive ion channel [Caenimonas koreensis DSM 17982]